MKPWGHEMIMEMAPASWKHIGFAQVQDAVDRAAISSRHAMRALDQLRPTMAQLNAVLNSMQSGDAHPDPLVESVEYPRPLPGWAVLRVYDRYRPLGISVVLMGDDGAPDTSALRVPREEWHHPCVEFVREVARQFVGDERLALYINLDLDRYPMSKHIAVRAEVWVMGDDGSLSLDSVHPEPPLIDHDKDAT